MWRRTASSVCTPDLLPGPADSPFERLTVDVRFCPAGPSLWLPSLARVTAGIRGTEFYNVHRFSDYRSTTGTIDTAPCAQASDRDAREAFVDGLVALRNRRPAEAVVALQDAVRLDPTPVEPHYQLGVALHEAHDLAGAERELRAVVQRAPGIAAGHSELATVLFERGDMAGASVEFRQVIKLDANDASAHGNLGEALMKLGDRPAAVEEYRIASTLVPGNAQVKARYESLRRDDLPVSASPETRIRVDVRQVLVPIVVTDREGHEVVGLQQSDFHVFEDGVEQKISGFTMERSDETELSDAHGGVPAQTTAGPPPAEALKAVPPPHRTYLICVDTLHVSFENFGRVREALTKLFRQEGGGDTWYALVLAGKQFEVVQQPTPDASKILSAVAAPKFWAAVAGSQKSSDRAALDDFHRRVEVMRRACDSSDPLEKMKCESGKRLLLLQADTLAQGSRVTEIDFLHRLRGVIEQMARMPPRRTLVLISDGFLLSPGRESYGLLAAYFPEIGVAGLRGMDRLQGDFEAVVRLAARHDIPIYAVDSRGLHGSEFFDASNRGSSSRDGAVMSYMDDLARESGDSLAEVAAATGGLFIHNTNDLLKGMERVLSDGRARYLVAYVPANGNLDGKFRAITVKLRDTKLAVRAKRGYWATEN